MSQPVSPSKLWGGPFTGNTESITEKCSNSLRIDTQLWLEDLVGSEKYAQALSKIGILSQKECDEICFCLSLIKVEWDTGTFKVASSDEDIHTANERRLIELAGQVGGKLHTGRSRQDQVVTDVRLWLRRQCGMIASLLQNVIDIGADTAEQHIDILQAAYTHCQPTQVVRYSHWLLSYIVPLLRDMERLKELVKRVNVCPLGSCELAGHAFGIDRSALGNSLGFADITLNSIDAVCDRDFVVEFMNWASLLMVHMSQFAEDAMQQHMQQCIMMSDAFCTGSALVSQKRNADALELLRGKSGRVIGHATGFLCTLKGLPHAYSKDLQEDKEPLMDTVQTVQDCLTILHGVLSTMEPVEAKLREKLVPEMLASDMAAYLVRKSVPFREALLIAGAAVKLAETKGAPLDQLTLEDLLSLHSSFEADVAALWSYEYSAESRCSVGGTAKARVLEQIVSIRTMCAYLAEST